MNIVVVAFEQAQVLDITGPMEVFAEANIFTDFTPYQVDCVSMSEMPVRMSNGLTLDVPTFKEFDEPIDTLLIPGGAEVLALDEVCIAWLLEKTACARRVASVCTGAFMLAKMGLLDGKRATTHWQGCERLKQLAPTALVEPDAIFTRDGNLYTSAGVTAGIDLALHLVEEDLGRTVALQIARHLVLYLRRPGGQSQFSAPLLAQANSGSRFGALVDYITTNPHANLSVEALSAKASMSVRNFSRAFKDETGITPAKFVANVRLEAVCTYLTQTRLPIKQIAAKAGYRSVDVLTRTFRDQFEITPHAYRQRFGSTER